MAWFGGTSTTAGTGGLIARGMVPTAPAPTIGTPTPPTGAAANASSSVLAAQQAAERQKKIAQAAQPLIGGIPKLGLPLASVQPKTLIGR